jgi:nucleoid-associated protein YgaU
MTDTPSGLRQAAPFFLGAIVLIGAGYGLFLRQQTSEIDTETAALVTTDAQEPKIEGPVLTEAELASVEEAVDTEETVGAVIVDEQVAIVLPEDIQTPEVVGEAPTVIDAPTPTEETPVAAVEPQPETDDLIAPTFDLVRIESDGSGIIAGKAAPNATVTIMMNGKDIGSAVAAGDGAFVALLDVPTGTTPEQMTLMSDQGNGEIIPSTDQVLVMPRGDDAPPKLVIAQADGVMVAQDDTAPTPQVKIETASTPEEPTVSDQTGEAALAARELAVTHTVETAEAVVEAVVETATATEETSDATAPQVLANLSLDTISYSETGDVVLGGRSSSNQFVRVYVDDKPIETERVPSDGSWQIVLDDVSEGVYKLRVDALDTSGVVVSRVESPFKREIPVETTGNVTIQPGFTLWELAEAKYGNGSQYIQIFEANSELIKDPNMIFPGQIFALPE